MGLAFVGSVGCVVVVGTDDGVEGSETDVGDDEVGTTGESGTSDESESESESEATDGGEALPGPFTYSEYDSDGVLMIDALFVLTEQAVEEIASLGETPDSFLAWRLDDLNGALERSLVDTSRVRHLGHHVLVEADYARTGVWPGDTNSNIAQALPWLSDYRSTYGADKILIVGSTAESQSGAAWGGGDVSSYWVEFLPINHEFGHCMGGGHCNEGDPDNYNFGFPLAGYDDQGFPLEPGLTGGTMMCGNSVNFFSNPDVTLTLDEIAGYVADGMMPDQDYASALGPGGTLTLGHELYANMAQTWRDNEGTAARATFTARYDGEADVPYANDDCAGFYAEEGYGGFVYEVCAGETMQGLGGDDIQSVKVGRNVHVNLYSDDQFGAGSTCGGILQRLAYSSPSLAALSEHHGIESIDGAVAAVAVYPPTDRETHWLFDGGFDFYGSGELPFCSSLDGEDLTLLRDGADWSAVAAISHETMDPPYAIEFELYSKHEGDDPPADGVTVFFAKDAAAYAAGPGPDGNLGFLADGTGYAVELNIWTNSVAVRDGNYEVVGQAVGADTYTDGAWVPVRVEVGTDTVTVFFGGQELLSQAVAVSTAYDGIGVGAGSGFYTSEFTLRNFALVPG